MRTSSLAGQVVAAARSAPARESVDAVLLRDAGLLAESPVWDERSGALYWVDVPAGTLHRRDARGHRDAWELGAELGCVVPCESGRMVAALRHGLCELDLGTGALRAIAHSGDAVRTRYNDGACDPRGRLWVGSLSCAGAPEAALYALRESGELEPVRRGAICSNGIGWSPDEETMYWVDSGRGAIFAFAFDADAGRAGEARTLVSGGPGLPDGLAVDVDGCIWCARWGGWGVCRYAPSGALLRTIELPVAHVTSVAFGGPARDRLYITTAAADLDPRERAAQPLAGAIFAHEPGVAGVPTARVRDWRAIPNGPLGAVVAQAAVRPPSMTSTEPVTKADASSVR